MGTLEVSFRSVVGADIDRRERDGLLNAHI